MIIKRALSSSISNFYDIIITGGGMIGSVLACKLASNPVFRNISILLIESGPKKPWNIELTKNKDNFSNRVSSLNNNTKVLLQKINVWDIIESCSCQDVSQIKVWGPGSNNISTTFDVEDNFNLDHLAYIVENDVLIAAVMTALNNYDNVHVLHDNIVTEYKISKNTEETVKLRLKNEEHIECNLLIGTDGINSKVRQAMDVQYLSWNYNQKAVVATLKIERLKDNNTAWQKFLHSGPIALLPLADEISSLVWTTTPDYAKMLLSLSEESFVDALNTALWKEPIKDVFASSVTNIVSAVLKTLNIHEKHEEIIPPTITQVLKNTRAAFPVGFGHAVSYVIPHVALVGDAAHRVHPLAGQGVNLGFGDVECLDSILSKYFLIGVKLGDIRALREYETIRQRCNVPKLIAIDFIQKIAGNSWSPLLATTNAGFQVTDAVSLLKKFFIDRAAT
ncbi:hypothetical protein PGB90_000303 [Kerria lacca]